MAVADSLGEFVHGCDLRFLPGEVVEKAKMCVLDWTGCAIAGMKDPAARVIARLASGQGGNGESTIVGVPAKVPALWAALANGAVSHAAEMDDGHRWAIVHPGVSTIPAALALAECRHASGRTLLEAVIAGYEMAIRVGECVGRRHYETWHTTGTCGTFGAAAASAKILGLNPEQVSDALGNAGTQAAGLWQFLEDRAMTKTLHPAKACFNGILAALLAESGFTGPHRIFEGEKGFCRATSSESDISILLSDLGSRYKIMESNFKVHASCGHTHSPIECALEICKSGPIASGSIESIQLDTYSVARDLISNPSPVTTFDAKFSAPYCIATALLYGRADQSRFEDEALSDPEVSSLASKVKVTVDPRFDSQFPECRPARVTVLLKDGKRLSAENYFRKGDPEKPLTFDEVIDKFLCISETGLSRKDADETIEFVRNLDKEGDTEVICRILGRVRC